TQTRWESASEAAATTLFDSLALSVGVDPKAWRSCVEQHATRALIQADRDRTHARGVNSTPTFFIGNDAVVEGAEPYERFRTAIDAALAKAPAAPKPET